MIFIAYKVQGWWNMILSQVKNQPHGRKVSEIILKRLWQTHRNISSHTKLFYKQAKKESSRRILYSSLLYLSNHPNIWWYILHEIYRLLRLKQKWIRGTTNFFLSKTFRTRRENSNSSEQIWKTRNNPPKGCTKTDPFYSKKKSKDRICHIIYSSVEFLEQV